MGKECTGYLILGIFGISDAETERIAGRMPNQGKYADQRYVLGAWILRWPGSLFHVHWNLPYRGLTPLVKEFLTMHGMASIVVFLPMAKQDMNLDV